MRQDVPDLMWVTDRRRSSMPLTEIARVVVSRGVNAIQVREKDLDRNELRDLVAAILEIVGNEAAVIVNSDADIAHDLGIGLHLPEAESMPEGFRPALLGRSVHSPEAAFESSEVDYLIAGHVFETGSKEGKTPIGPGGLARIVLSTGLPVLAIGGLTAENAKLAMDAGADGLAVMSGIGSAADPGEAAAGYRAAIDRFRMNANKEV